MKTITVLTATRAEYGLLRPIIKALKACPEFCVKVVVTGAHLSPEFGLTYREIEKDGIGIDRKIDILLSSDTPAAISKSMGMAMIGFADYFAVSETDALLVLGDRYETLAVCCAAMNERIPIIHLYGGETTEGAIDEAVRHAITKLSYLHLTSTEEYRNRVIQLGESPDRVYTVGAVGIENVLNTPLFSKCELEKFLNMKLDAPYAVVTFHPVTLEGSSARGQCIELIQALDKHPEMKFVITKANADADGRVINRLFDEYAKGHDHVKVYDSLGLTGYLSAVKYSDMVIGNSSSGLIEVPSLHVPTINIGNRQRGRLKAKSVIDCLPEKDDILRAMCKMQTAEFREGLEHVVNPYGSGKTSSQIVKILLEQFKADIDLRKQFYNVKYEKEAE